MTLPAGKFVSSPRPRGLISLALAALPVLAGPAFAADRRVPKDFGTIQEAVDAAADNDRILIAPGTYTENVTVAKNGLLFVGKQVVIDGTLANGTDGTALNVTGNGISITGITFRNGGTQVQISGDGAVIRKCTFRNGSSNGVRIAGATATVDRCVFVASESDSVSVTGADASITACKIKNSGDGGVNVSGSGARVERCTIQNMIDDAAIAISGTGAFVSRNRVSACDDYGIEVNGTDARVESNLVSATDSTGIYVSGTDARVESNLVSATGSTGIYVSGDNPSIVANTVSNIAGEASGIEVRGTNPGGLVERNIVSDTTEDGIQVNNPGATVRGNTVQRVGGEDDAGYDLSGAGIIAEDNRAIDCDDYGFEILAADITLRRCTATNSMRSGFFVGTNANVTIDACSATGSGIAGIENTGTSTVLRNSKFSNNRRDVTNNGTYTTFQGNTFRTGGPTITVFDL